MSITGFTTSNYLSRGSAVVTGVPALLSVWVNFDTTTGFETAVAIGGGFRHYFGVGSNGSAAGRATAREGGTPADATTSTTYTSGTWVHIAGIFVATNDRRVQLDAAGEGTDTNTRSPTLDQDTSVGVLVHNNGGTVVDPVDGDVASVTIWDITGLSEAQYDQLVADLANGDNPSSISTSATLEAYWRLCDTTDINDQSGNGNHLSITGSLSNGASHPSVSGECAAAADIPLVIMPPYIPA